MSKTNGSSESWRERLDRVEASHVKLMTDMELFWRKQEKAWRKHKREHEEWRRQYEADRAADREAERLRGEALDERIGRLITAMGAFVARREGGAQ